MVRIPTLTHRTRAFIAIAVAGSIPLTLGVIMWITGTSMGLASHPGWAGVAEVGVILMLAGLLCGLALIVVTTVWLRGRPGPWPSPTGEEWSHAAAADLIPTASPEPQSFEPQPLEVQPPDGPPPAHAFPPYPAFRQPPAAR